MANYRQPRRLNAFSVVLLLMVAGAGYWLWVFMPVYFDAWTVDHALREGAATMYQLNKLAEPGRTEEMRKLLKKIQSDSIRLAHIDDPEFDVSLELQGDRVEMRASYTVVVRHPVGNWVTTMHMKRVEDASVKQVKWE